MRKGEKEKKKKRERKKKRKEKKGEKEGDMITFSDKIYKIYVFTDILLN